MVNREMRLEEARQRALIISDRIRERSDLAARRAIEEFAALLDYENRLEDLAIAPEAWQHVQDAEIDPKLVFAHPDILRAHPETSLHYRGLATLSLKRVQAMATQVKSWEEGTYRRQPTLQRCQSVARTYNAVISVIITGTDGWTLENGYRNVLATIGISEDGSLRNIVGQEGEEAVKGRISEWLALNEAIATRVEGTVTELGDDGNLRMTYGSEPDISFEQPGRKWRMANSGDDRSEERHRPSRSAGTLGRYSKELRRNACQV